jgi:hypothetical protein
MRRGNPLITVYLDVVNILHWGVDDFFYSCHQCKVIGKYPI